MMGNSTKLLRIGTAELQFIFRKKLIFTNVHCVLKIRKNLVSTNLLCMEEVKPVLEPDKYDKE